MENVGLGTCWVLLFAWGWPEAGWYLLAAAALLCTALYSGSEIGIFSLSRVRLRLRAHRGDAAALELTRWLVKPTYALEGLLILQNISGFAFTAAVTAILSGYGFSEAGQAVVSTLVITPIILIFTEVLPKDMFHQYADQWVYRLVPFLKWCFRCITVVPILPLVRLMSRVSTYVVSRGRSEGQNVTPRAEILNLFQESTASGAMSGTQQDLVQRAMRMARITIREVMIPWNRVVGVPATISRDGFRALVRRYPVSRVPVLGKSTTEVMGVIQIMDVLGDPGGFRLQQHVHPAMTLIGEQSVRSAITLMQRAHQTLAIVVDRQNRAIGLVTMKDLVEELIGDLENW